MLTARLDPHCPLRRYFWEGSNPTEFVPGRVYKVRLAHLATPHQPEAMWKDVTLAEVMQVVTKILTACEFDTDILGPLDVFSVSSCPAANAAFEEDRRLFGITGAKGGEPPFFSLGFVKGTARATAAMAIAWAAALLGIPLVDLGGAKLLASLQSVSVRLHAGKTEELFFRSMSAREFQALLQCAYH